MKIGGIEIKSGPGAFTDRTNWTGTQIQGSEKKNVFGSWFGAIFPLFVFGTFFLFTRQHVFIAKNFPHPFLIVIALVTLFSVPKAIWETIRLKRFGDPILELGTAPIPLGGTVEGRINFGSGVDSKREFTVTLACIRHHHTSGAGNSSGGVIEKVLWSTEQKATPMLGGILPVSMAVPTDQPQTNGANPFDRILWRVTVRSSYFGPGFLEKYEVPVGQPPALLG
jgi:hypothetical protein